MTIAEAIQRVQSLYSKGVQSDDTRLTERHIYSKLKTVREKFILQLYVQTGYLDDKFYTLIHSTELENGTFNLSGYTHGECPALQSICEFDIVTNTTGNPFIKDVQSLDSFKLLSYIRPEMVYRIKHQRLFLKNTMKYTYYNKRIMVINGSKIKQIKFKAIFRDPLDYYVNCTESSCVRLDNIDFPAPDKYMDDIISATANTLLNVYMSIPHDNKEDSQDDRTVQQPQKTEK